MSVTDSIADIGKKLAELYREVVTTSVRFDELQRSTDKTLSKVEATIEQLIDKVAAIHDEHVREKAQLAAEIRTLEGRLNALSEHAMHVVAKDAAREVFAEALTFPPEASERKEASTSVSLRVPVKRDGA